VGIASIYADGRTHGQEETNRRVSRLCECARNPQFCSTCHTIRYIFDLCTDNVSEDMIVATLFPRFEKYVERLLLWLSCF
jgi:hypothetical protein